MPIARLPHFQPRPHFRRRRHGPRSLNDLRRKEIRNLTERKVDALAHTSYMDTSPTRALSRAAHRQGRIGICWKH